MNPFPRSQSHSSESTTNEFSCSLVYSPIRRKLVTKAKLIAINKAQQNDNQNKNNNNNNNNHLHNTGNIYTPPNPQMCGKSRVHTARRRSKPKPQPESEPATKPGKCSGEQIGGIFSVLMVVSIWVAMSEIIQQIEKNSTPKTSFNQPWFMRYFVNSSYIIMFFPWICVFIFNRKITSAQQILHHWTTTTNTALGTEAHSVKTSNIITSYNPSPMKSTANHLKRDHSHSHSHSNININNNNNNNNNYDHNHNHIRTTNISINHNQPLQHTRSVNCELVFEDFEDSITAEAAKNSGDGVSGHPAYMHGVDEHVLGAGGDHHHHHLYDDGPEHVVGAPIDILDMGDYKDLLLQSLRPMMFLSVFVTGYGYFWYLSLPLTVAAVNNTIYQSNCVFVLFFSKCILRSEKIDCLRFFACCLAMTGVAVVSFFSSSPSSSGNSDSSLLGLVFCLCSTVFYALFQVLFKYFSVQLFRFGYELSDTMFLQFVLGVCNLLLSWPLFFIFDWTSVEPFIMPANMQQWLCVLIPMALDFAYTTFLLLGITLSGTVFMSVGSLLVIPATFVVDVWLHGLQITFPAIVGSFLILIAFLLIEFAQKIQALWMAVCKKTRKHSSQSATAGNRGYGTMSID